MAVTAKQEIIEKVISDLNKEVEKLRKAKK